MRIEKNSITDEYMKDDSDKDKSTLSIWNVLDYYGHYYREIECFDSEFKQLLNEKIADLLKNELLIKFKDIMKLETKNYYPILLHAPKYLSTVHISSTDLDDLKETYFKDQNKNFKDQNKNFENQNFICKNLDQFCNFKARNCKDLIKKVNFENNYRSKLYTLLKFEGNQPDLSDDHIEKLKDLEKNFERHKDFYYIWEKNRINEIKENIPFFEVKRIIQVAIEYKNLCSYKKMSGILTDKDNDYEIWCIKSREMLKIFTPSSILEKSESPFMSHTISELTYLRHILEHPFGYCTHRDIKDDWRAKVIDELKDLKLRLDGMVNKRLTSLKEILKENFKNEFLWRILTLDKDIQFEITNERFKNLKKDKVKKLLNDYDLKSIDETSFETFKKLNNRFNYIYDKLENYENYRNQENLFQNQSKHSKLKIFKLKQRKEWIDKCTKSHIDQEALKHLKESLEKNNLEDFEKKKISKKDIEDLFPSIKRKGTEAVLDELKKICSDLQQKVSKMSREDLKKKLEDESQLDFQLSIDLIIIKAYNIMDNYLEGINKNTKYEQNAVLMLNRIYHHIKPCRNFIVHEPWKTRYNKEDVVYILSGLCLEVVQKLLPNSSPVSEKKLKLDGLYHYDDKHKQILHNLAEPEPIISLAKKLYQQGAIVTMSSEDGTILDLALKNGHIEYAQFIQKLRLTGLERSKRLQNFRFLLQHDSVENIQKFITNQKTKIFDPVDYPIAISVLKNIHAHRSIEERIDIIEEFLNMKVSNETLCQINSKEIKTGNSVGHYLVMYEYDVEIGNFIKKNKIDMNQTNKKGKSPIYELIDHHTGENLQMWLEYFLNDSSIDDSEKKRLLKEILSNEDDVITLAMTLSPPVVKYIRLKNNYLIETKKDDIVYEIRLDFHTDKSIITKCCFEKLLNLGKKKLNCKVAKIILVFQFSDNSSKKIPLTFSIENLSNSEECCMTLGSQFLEENEVIIDFKKKCLTMQKLEIELGPDNSISKSPNRI